MKKTMKNSEMVNIVNGLVAMQGTAGFPADTR